MGGLEIELKAGLDPRVAFQLARRLSARAGAPGRISLHATYFDTPDRQLAAAGISLRVRRQGRNWVQAAKWGRTGHGGFQQLHEVECPVPGPMPDIAALPPALRATILAAAAGNRIERWFETRIQRRIWNVRHAIGLVEVALDRGTIEADRGKEPVLEAEFELKEGSPEAVFGLAAEVLGDLPISLLLPSKAKRGSLLADGLSANADHPSRPAPRAAGEDGAESWRMALHALAAAIAFESHRLFTSDDPEGPHQLRVALRRLRAAERFHRRLLHADVAAELADGARAIGRLVAPLRDSDMVIEAMRANRQVPASLMRALVDENARIRSDVRGQLRRSNATGFAIRLMQLANMGGWHTARRLRPITAGQLAASALTPRWRRVSKLADRLAALDDDQRHELRKELKKLRYLYEICSFDSKNDFRLHLKKLQEALGILNDLSMLQAWSSQRLPATVRPAFEIARDGLLQSAQSRADLALGRACRHWQALRVLPRPWETPFAP